MSVRLLTTALVFDPKLICIMTLIFFCFYGVAAIVWCGPGGIEISQCWVCLQPQNWG